MATDTRLTREAVERLLLETDRGCRFTQDSPVLPDFWLAFVDPRVERLDVLVNPHWDSTAGQVARALEARLVADRESRTWRWWSETTGDGSQAAGVAYNGSAVVARLRLDELVRVVLPMTPWWKAHVWRGRVADQGGPGAILADDAVQKRLARELVDPGLPPQGEESPHPVPEELVWMLRLVAVLASRRLDRTTEDGDPPAVERFLPAPGDPEPGDPGWEGRTRERLEAAERMVESVQDLFDGALDGRHRQGGLEPAADDEPRVFSVHRNRRASASVCASALTVKADAARQLFSIDASALAWAVVDSGVDATHPAFAVRDERGRPVTAGGEPLPPGDDEAARTARDELLGHRFPFRTRIAGTFDFSLIRHVLASDDERLGERRAELEELLERSELVPPARLAAWRAEAEQLERIADWRGGSRSSRARAAKELRRSLQKGRAIDWTLLAELLEIPHTEEGYRRPEHNHGTHVAGILAGDWRRADRVGSVGRQDLVGIAPDLRLYDLRVLGPDGTGDEFSVIAALQFLRHLNAHKDFVVVHGANLSLSIRHEVINYACGATPVCEEAERLVASGVVVVAAAGNRGHVTYVTTEGPSEGYQSISITDPGNAASVLTVGATHRSSPHTYGVSYFSSRGPTGDGRVKPDLVAPGEKILGPVPGADGPGACLLDGTSMAAPHVSGAAALLMARHRELAGDPVRVRQILTATATDLGRERYFQGAGMVDALRALQSI